MSEPHEMSAAELSSAYASKELSPVEVAEALLGRIEALDAEVNAFCLIDAPATLKQAEDSQERWMAGGAVVGARRRAGRGEGPAAHEGLGDAARLADRGRKRSVDGGCADGGAPARGRCVFIGTTTTPEFGWKGSTDSPLSRHHAQPVEQGEDAGRFVGRIVGGAGGALHAARARHRRRRLDPHSGEFHRDLWLKPSFGRVPAYPLSPFGTVAHVGPMTRTVRDAALMMDAISKPDARDWFNVPDRSLDHTARLRESMKGRRIAFSPRLGYAKKVLPEVEALVAAAVKRFETMGAVVERVDPSTEDPSEIFQTLWWAGAGFLLGDLPEGKKAQLDPGLRKMAEEGAKIPLKTYLAANAARGTYGSRLRPVHGRLRFHPDAFDRDGRVRHRPALSARRRRPRLDAMDAVQLPVQPHPAADRQHQLRLLGRAAGGLADRGPDVRRRRRAGRERGL